MGHFQASSVSPLASFVVNNVYPLLLIYFKDKETQGNKN